MAKQSQKKRKNKSKKARRYARCIKRYSLRVNLSKWWILLDILASYAREKDRFLVLYAGVENIDACYRFYEIRNGWVQSKYKNPDGLQARQWKLALKDSLETLDRYWAAMAVGWKKRIYGAKDLSETQKRYLLQAISTRKSLYLLLNDDKLQLPQQLTEEERKQALRFFRQLVKETVKSFPRVRIKRSFLAEPETYRVFTHNGRRYIAIMTKERGVRVIIPLSGKGKISGQIRIMLDFEKRRIEIHHLEKSKAKNQSLQGDVIGIDLGITEVFTDSGNDRWGTNFGKTLAKVSDEQKAKGQKRNKLKAVAEKSRAKGDKSKACRINSYNLGKKKQKKKHRKCRRELERQVNESLNLFLKNKNPKKVVYEDLTHMRGKAKSKKMSRLVSAWTRRIIRERLQFKVGSQGSSLLQAVNCAHSSRVCPICGLVAKGNRKGDKFKCLLCGHTAASDFTAAVEILRRENNPEIRLWTPTYQVRSLLLKRFRRRLENQDFPLPLSQPCWEELRKEFPGEFMGELQRIFAKKQEKF